MSENDENILQDMCDKTDDWHAGYIAGSEAQHESSHEYIIKPLNTEIARLKAENKELDGDNRALNAENRRLLKNSACIETLKHLNSKQAAQNKELTEALRYADEQLHTLEKALDKAKEL